ncbi:glycosyltransferase family A protein [Aequorivita sp. Q41]|uniref:glycosyltransferase family 2 protein n=1 Tax=Aequorivita sp. Q41 TaxID=3153300 RepID=UPI0032427211
MPKFSVIIPLYNKEKDFPLTLKSVMAQTFKDFEVIIVNDGSTDNSLAIAEAEAKTDSRIKIFNKKNEGLAATRNYGVARANTEDVIWIDADDSWHPFHLENMAAILKKLPEAQWFAAAYEKKHSDNLTRSMIAPTLEKGENWIGVIEDYFKESMVDSLTHPSSVGMKKSFFLNLGGHNTAITFSEDTDLWIRAALKAPLAFSNKISATIMLDSSNRLNHTSLKTRIFPDYDVFNAQAEMNSSLKKYLDVHRFSIALNYKLDGDIENFKKYKSKIATTSLNSKQRLLLGVPKVILVASKRLKEMLHTSGFYFSVYR